MRDVLSFLRHYVQVVFVNVYGLLLVIVGLVDLVERIFDKKARVPVWLRTAIMISIFCIAQIVAYKQLSDKTSADLDAMKQRAENAEALQKKVQTSPQGTTNAALERKVASLEAQWVNVERRQRIIKQLADFSNEGIAIGQRCLTRAPEHEILAEKAQWERRVELYLTQQLGESYVVRFRNPSEAPLTYPHDLQPGLMSTWADIQRKVEMLGIFLEKSAR